MSTELMQPVQFGKRIQIVPVFYFIYHKVLGGVKHMSDTVNTVKTEEGVEVYTDDIYIYAEEYIDTLYDKESIYSSTGNTFTGMIKYINRHIGFTKDIYADINILNDIWEVYTDLVYKYNQKPTIEEYCLLIGISRETIYTWMRGEYRSGDICEKFGSSRSDTIKKWQEECRLGRYKSAASGNVGGIFLCKAVDGMVETAPVQVENQAQRQSLEEIAAKYRLESSEKGEYLEPPKADF